MGVDPSRWEVPPDRLRWECGPSCFPFVSTAEVPPLGEIVGQARALKALRMGLEMPSPGYNIFVTGMAGTGRTSTVKRLMESLGLRRDPPPDICYVHNFADPGSPRALILPAGLGARLRRDLEELVTYVQRVLPGALESKAHTARRKAVLEKVQRQDRTLVEAFEREVTTAGFRFVAVEEGPHVHAEIIPVVEGQPVALEELARRATQQPEMRAQVEELQQRQAALLEQMQELMRTRRRLERELREELRAVDRAAAGPLVDTAVHELRDRYGLEKLSAHLEDVREGLLADMERLASQQEEASDAGAAPGAERRDPLWRYRVNVVVDNSRTRGAPIIQEPNPTLVNLFGVVERPPGRAEDAPEEFVSIRAGSLLRANGGYLVIDAHDLMGDPVVWPAFKRALKNRVAEIQSSEAGYVLTPSAIKPEPVTIDVKVVLIGELALYHALYGQDDDFRKIFKVRADFDTEMPLNEENLRRYAAFVSKICQEEGLLPFDMSAVAAVSEHGVRLSGRQTKLSVQFSEVADVIREASYWARSQGDSCVEGQHVRHTLRERAERSSLLEDKIREMVQEGLLLIETDGQAVGQVNGLTVLDMGDYVFGRPVKITATTAMGRSGVINIERESYLSGKTHDKGVLILAGFLRGKYAQDKPLTVSASLCFEQSYGSVDGDSASSAEVYAVLSSLAELPVKQSLAVTGSVNQHGQVQAVGGVNEKIESFFDLCRLRGLTGRQGVIIPRANVPTLMLRPDVVEAVRKNQFHIYAVTGVDEGMEILTDLPAGERQLTESPPGPDGQREPLWLFPPGTVNARVDDRLHQLAMDLKYYGEEGEEPGETGPRRPDDDEEAAEG